MSDSNIFALSVPCKNGKIHNKLSNSDFWRIYALRLGTPNYFDKVIMFYRLNRSRAIHIIEKLTPFLAFDKMEIILDNINVPANFWALGKIYAYQYASVVYKEPFVHFDYDSFIIDNVVDALQRQRIIVQHKETEEFYSRYSAYGLRPNKFAYNMGVFGGSDVNAIADYSAGALETANKLRHFSHPIKDRLISCIFEQKYLYDFCEKEKIRPYLVSQNCRESYRHYWHNKQDAGAVQEALNYLSRSYLGT